MTSSILTAPQKPTTRPASDETLPHTEKYDRITSSNFMLLLEHEFTTILTLLPSVQSSESSFPTAVCKWRENNYGKVILQAWLPHRTKFPRRIHFLVLFLLVDQDSFSNRLLPSHTEMQVSIFGRFFKLVFINGFHTLSVWSL